MCINTGGLCTTKRVINLKKSVELTGNIIPSQPQSYFGLIFRIILFIVFLIVLSIGASDTDPDTSTERELFTSVFAFFTITLYLFYLLFVILFTLAFQICKMNCSPALIGIIYMLLLPLIQSIIATSFQIFIRGAGEAFYFVFLLVIILEFLTSTVQFHYIYGALAVVLYNILYIILFDVAIINEAGIADTAIDNGEYVSWIVLSIVWHLCFTYLKNYINVRWFTSQRITKEVKNMGLLSQYSSDSVKRGSKAFYNNSVEDNEFCTVAMGSCTDQKITPIPVYQALHREEPNVVLLLGDNVYADLAPPTTTKMITQCCKITRVFKEEYDLLLKHRDFRPKSIDFSGQQWLALWDDHDYGENDAAQDYSEKVQSKAAFIEFLESLNQDEQITSQFAEIKNDDKRGVYYSFDYSQELDSGVMKLRLIMLDTRYDRAEDDSDIVGAEQWQWLREQLSAENDDNIDWYIIANGSPVLNEGKGGKKTVGQQTRDGLFEILNGDNGRVLDKTVLLSGDLHYSVWHSWEERVYELTTSSMTHSKPWFCCKCWYKYLEIEQYTSAKENNGNGATSKSRDNCQKNSFGVLKINKEKFAFCVKDAFGYSYLNVEHTKK